MATLRSGCEPDSSLASAARLNSESIELDSINHFREEARNNASAQPSVPDVKTTPATTEPAHATPASTPRRTSVYDSNIELSAINPQHDEARAAEAEFSLPPVDTGKDAWLFLFSAFMMDILVWGTSFFDHIHALANTTQVFPLPTASSRNTTLRTHPSRASETLLSLVPALWDSCTSLHRWSLACLRGIPCVKGLVS